MAESLETKVNETNGSNHKYPAHIRGMSWLLTKFPTKTPKINNFTNHSSGFSESFSEMLFEAYSSAEYYAGKSLKIALGTCIKGYIGAAPGVMLQEIALDAEQRYGIKVSPKTVEIYSLFITGLSAIAWLLAFHHVFKLPWIRSTNAANMLDNYRRALSEITLFAEIPARLITLAIWNQVTGVAPAEIGYLYYKPHIEPKIKPYIEPTKNFLRNNLSSFKEDLKLSYSFYSSQLELVKESVKNFLSQKSGNKNI